VSLRAAIAAAAAVAAIATVTAGVASAAPADRASCTAILTSFEATQLPAGFVGGEVSGLAGPDLGVVVSRLASSRLGSLESCAAIAP
jgi:hypothetical protein